jgi:hypothetical protein
LTEFERLLFAPSPSKSTEQPRSLIYSHKKLPVRDSISETKERFIESKITTIKKFMIMSVLLTCQSVFDVLIVV